MYTEVCFLRPSSISARMMAELAANGRVVAAMYAHTLYIIAAVEAVSMWSMGCCVMIKTPDLPDVVFSLTTCKCILSKILKCACPQLYSLKSRLSAELVHKISS